MVNLFSDNDKDVFTSDVITCHETIIGDFDLLFWKTRISPFNLINKIFADDLVTQVARASANMM